MKNSSKLIGKNKKAYFDYEILQTYEAGVVLVGSEVKALRENKVSIKESFVKIIKEEAFLFGMHITHLNTVFNAYKPKETRDRKLLLHKKEIFNILKQCINQGISIVPLRIYFNKRNLVKIEIAVVKGKKLYDKRNSIKQREQNIDIKRALKRGLSD